MVALELAQYLESQGEGTIDANLFISYQPALPDNCITVYDETAPGLEESDSLQVDNFGIQVLVRASRYTDAMAKIMSIHKKLVGFGGQKFIAEGSEISEITISSGPTGIGRDEKNRAETTAHYTVRALSTGDSHRI